MLLYRTCEHLKAVTISDYKLAKQTAGVTYYFKINQIQEIVKCTSTASYNCEHNHFTLDTCVLWLNK